MITCGQPPYGNSWPGGHYWLEVTVKCLVCEATQQRKASQPDSGNGPVDRGWPLKVWPLRGGRTLAVGPPYWRCGGPVKQRRFDAPPGAIYWVVLDGQLLALTTRLAWYVGGGNGCWPPILTCRQWFWRTGHCKPGPDLPVNAVITQPGSSWPSRPRRTGLWYTPSSGVTCPASNANTDVKPRRVDCGGRANVDCSLARRTADLCQPVPA